MNLWKLFGRNLLQITHAETLENLKVRWTFKEVKELHDLTNAVFNKIKLNHIEFPTINTEFKIKKAIIHKNVSLYFKIERHS